MTSASGFQELPHTADWAMRVWAPDLPTLFMEAARGLNTLSGAQLARSPRLEREFTQSPSDNETLLVAFLSELVFLQEQERLAFDAFDISLVDGTLSVHMQGAPLAGLEKPIKAVTYHNLQIARTDHGYQVEVVFDV